MVRVKVNFNFHQNFKILLDIFHRCLWMLTQSHSFISFHLIELQHSMYINFCYTKLIYGEIYIYKANFNFHQNFKILLDILHRCLWMLTQSHSFISFRFIELQHSMYINFCYTKVNVWWEIRQILNSIKISKSLWTYSIGVCECWHKVTASYLFVS